MFKRGCQCNFYVEPVLKTGYSCSDSIVTICDNFNFKWSHLRQFFWNILKSGLVMNLLLLPRHTPQLKVGFPFLVFLLCNVRNVITMFLCIVRCRVAKRWMALDLDVSFFLSTWDTLSLSLLLAGDDGRRIWIITLVSLQFFLCAAGRTRSFFFHLLLL